MKKLFTILFTALMLLSAIGTTRVYAEGGTVASEGKPLPSDYEQKATKLSNDGGLYHHSGTYEDLGDNGNDMRSGPYTVTFDVDYYGTPLTAEVTVSLDKDHYAPDSNGYCKAYIDKANLLQVGWYRVNNAKTQWDISLYDENGKSYLKYFLIGFMDPDESDYVFTSAGRDIYYDDSNLPKDPNKKRGSSTEPDVTSLNANQYYLVNGGFRRSSSTVYKFNDAIFAVSVPKGEETFTFYTETPDEGALQVPYLYTRDYDIYYNLGDEVGNTKATIEDGNKKTYASSPYDLDPVVVNPTRQGYRFVGWRETDEDWKPLKSDETEDYSTTIPADASGDKYYKAYWEPIKYNVEYVANVPEGTPNIAEDNKPSGDTEAQLERQFDSPYELSPNAFELKGYKFQGWSLEEGVKDVVYNDKAPYTNLTDIPDGTVTLYAQWTPIEYLIKYDPNEPNEAPAATGTMADDEHRAFDTDYNLTKNVYDIEGYDFLGWSTVEGVQPVTYADEAGYRNLTEADGGIITMYAQWEPWIYKIKYVANGGEGEMPDQTFYYRDTNMMSSENKFERDGYKFVGFDYDYDGVKYHIDNYDQFVEKMKAHKHYFEITLVAQWEKLPDPVKTTTTYIIPVTGVE